MSIAYEKLKKAYESVRSKTDFVPSAALTLGSGLGAFADEEIDIIAAVDYKDIEGFPVSTVAGHKGRFVFGTLRGTDIKVAVMQGRVHCYEGYPASDAVMPARLLGMLGAKTLILTNASGGINEDLSAGDLMLITDHISLFAPNPLIGENIDELGTRFPDMSCVYDKPLRDKIKRAAEKLGIDLKEGVYAQLTGPSFETPAEIRALRTLGADAVGMSTAAEAIAARHAGMRVCGISCISNQAAGISKNILTHEEVQQTADRTAPKFKSLIAEIIRLADEG